MLVLCLLTTSAFVTTFQARGQVPEHLSFQGTIFDTGGSPVDTTVDMTFKLYKGGVLVWTETHPSVQVVGGGVNVELGTLTPLDTVGFNENIELGVKIGTDPGDRSAYAARPESLRAKPARPAHRTVRLDERTKLDRGPQWQRYWREHRGGDYFRRRRRIEP